VDNIERVLSRGERIELLVDKTDAMSSQARAFRKRSQALRRRMWWRNTKLIALIVFVVVVSPSHMSAVLVPADVSNSSLSTCSPPRPAARVCGTAGRDGTLRSLRFLYLRYMIANPYAVIK
jgi:Synaptobrevin